MLNFTSPISCLDFYKVDHVSQYLPGVTKIVSNLTPRGSRIDGINKVVWFGLQKFLIESLHYHWQTFFGSEGADQIDEFESKVRTSLGNPSYCADFLRNLRKLGYLPIEVKALREGTAVPMRVPCMTIHNTHDDFAWLPNFLETYISAELWHPSTSATIAAKYREVFDSCAEKTGSPKAFCDWQGHDFSCRGMGNMAMAAASGAGHLLSFTGTDTVPALDYAREYYGATGFTGGSVSATEHSVMTIGGEQGEEEVLEHLLKTYPTGVVSVVSDSYDFWAFVKLLGTKFKDRILARDGKLVVRPDSGDPVKILCGDPKGKTKAEKAGLIEILAGYFGTITNEKGYKVLDSHIGAIYGDSITLERQEAILSGLAAKGFASCNIVLGIGSFCVTPNTPILCSDLVWRDAGSIATGQEIIAFDEYPSYRNKKKAVRRYRLARIEENSLATKTCIKISTDIGNDLTASYDHPVLVYAKNRKTSEVFMGDDKRHKSKECGRGQGFAWRKMSDLRIGDKIALMVNPWSSENNNTRSTGWLEGIFDGEGCVARSTETDRLPAWKISVSQNKGPVLDRIISELNSRNFGTYVNDRKCSNVHITGGFTEVIRFLGEIRPGRLLRNKLTEILSEMPALKANATVKLATVMAISNCGNTQVASIRTSSGTFITGGYLTHNTYQHVTRDTFGWAIKATHATRNGVDSPIFKRPKTDNGTKFSARGLPFVTEKLELIENVSWDKFTSSENQLQTVFRDGRICRMDSFAEIRKHLARQCGRKVD